MDQSLRAMALSSSRIAMRSRPCPRCGPRAPPMTTEQRRNFSITNRRSLRSRPDNMSEKIQSKLGESKKSKTQHLKKNQFPTDLGLFPGTLIPRPWSSYYKLIWENPRLWLRISFTLAVTPMLSLLRNYFTLRVSRGSWYNKKKGGLRKPKKLPLLLSGRIRTALELHHDLNKAIASGDTTWLQDNACSGLRDKARNHIARRNRAGTPQESWEISGYPGPRSAWVPSWPLCTLIPAPFRAYKVIVDTCGALPIGNDNLIRQVIVRISSIQKFDKQDGKGEQKKTLTEYVAIQQLVWDGKPGEWRIWGTVNPSTIEDIEKSYKTVKEQEGSFSDRMRAALPGNMGANLPF